jgi:hypothetical protein
MAYAFVQSTGAPAVAALAPKPLKRWITKRVVIAPLTAFPFTVPANHNRHLRLSLFIAGKGWEGHPVRRLENEESVAVPNLINVSPPNNATDTVCIR